MTGYLLDTHAAIWFFNGDDLLSAKANNIIRDLSNPIFISVASAWELSIKIGIGKLNFGGKVAGFIHLAEANDITILPIKTIHLTALAEQMILITADENIARYNISQIH